MNWNSKGFDKNAGTAEVHKENKLKQKKQKKINVGVCIIIAFWGGGGGGISYDMKHTDGKFRPKFRRPMD
jgi:hypothetical protein